MIKLAAPLLALLTLLPSVSLGDDVGDARKAELAYFLTQDCGSCHGLTLKGGLGKPLTPDVLSVFTDEDLLVTILDGRPGTAMPPWRGVINEAEARYLVRLLREGGRK